METFLMYGKEEKKALQPLLRYLKVPCGPVWPTGLTDSAESDVKAVICWGKNSASGNLPDAGVPFVFNPPSSARQALNKAKLRQLLKINGLGRLRSEGRVTARIRYKIPVFHLEALAVFQDRPSTYLISEAANPCKYYTEIAYPADDKHMQRLCKQAIRTIYALGLDFGLVYLCQNQGGEICVEDVEPWPAMDDRLGELFAQAIHRFDSLLAEELKRHEPPLIGMDPEFVLVANDNRLVHADRFLRRQGKAGCDVVNIQGKVYYPLAELRPDPAEEPRDLMIHLWQTMRAASRKITDKNLKWLAGGMPMEGFPLGGHLHLSRIWLNSKLLRAMDNYLALPLLLLEPESSLSRRPRFGCLGDFRLKPHGGFEYRTLPSWLVQPGIARGVMALTRLIADHYRELNVFPLTIATYQALYYEGAKQELLDTVQKLWAKLERLSGYQRYEKDLNRLKSKIYRLEAWDEQLDFRQGWQIPPFSVS